MFCTQWIILNMHPCSLFTYKRQSQPRILEERHFIYILSQVLKMLSKYLFISHHTKAVPTQYGRTSRSSEVPYPAPPLLLMTINPIHCVTLGPFHSRLRQNEHRDTSSTHIHTQYRPTPLREPNNRLNWRIYFRKYTASVIGQLFFPAAIYISFLSFIRTRQLTTLGIV